MVYYPPQDACCVVFLFGVMSIIKGNRKFNVMETVKHKVQGALTEDGTMLMCDEPVLN